jgi:hypothetical protein
MVALFLKAHSIISRAVEEGVAYGIRRAHKHDDNPSEAVLQENIEREVMNALNEVIDYEKYELIEHQE